MACSKNDDWRRKTESVAARDQYILENEKYTDCSFLVGDGPERVEIRCHRVYLAKTSPVFETMLYGPKNQQFKIPVTDTTPAAFKAFLRFLYMGVFDYEDYVQTIELYTMAQKYLMPDSFIANLRIFLWNKMPTNLLAAIEVLPHDEELHGNALTLMKYAFSELRYGPEWKHLSQATLLRLLQSDELNCHEYALINVCRTWAKLQVCKDGKVGIRDVTEEQVKAAMSPLIPHLRFLTLKPTDLVSLTKGLNFLPHDVSFKLIAHLTSPAEVTAPAQVCSVTHERGRFEIDQLRICGIPQHFMHNHEVLNSMISFPDNSIYLFKSEVSLPAPLMQQPQNLTQSIQSYRGKFEIARRTSFKNQGWRKMIGDDVVNDLTKILASKQQKIRATVATRIDPNKQLTDTYEEKCTIVLRPLLDQDICFRHSVSKNVAYNSQVTIEFNIEGKLPNGTFETFVFYHLPGVYPVKVFKTCVI